MWDFTSAVLIGAALFFSFAVALLLEELIFGGISACFFGPRLVASQAKAEMANKRN